MHRGRASRPAAAGRRTDEAEREKQAVPRVGIAFGGIRAQRTDPTPVRVRPSRDTADRLGRVLANW